MGKRTTFAGYVRARGATATSSGKLTGPSPGVMKITQAVPVDPTAADGTGTGRYLPAGAVILAIDIVSGHTGGTAPTLNIGIDDGVTPDTDALIVAAVATTDYALNFTSATFPGATFAAGAALATDVEVTAGTAGGTPGTGTSIAYITYTFNDDGVIND